MSETRELTQRERAGGGAAGGSPASHSALSAVFFLAPTFPGVSPRTPMQVLQAPHLPEGTLSRPEGFWHAGHRMTWARDLGVPWHRAFLAGDSGTAGKGFKPRAAGQTFRLESSADPAFLLLHGAFLCLFLLQSPYSLSAPPWLGPKSRGTSGSGGRAVFVLVRVISCRAALAPPVPALRRCSTSLNCTSAPQLSLQCLAAQEKASPSNEKRL